MKTAIQRKQESEKFLKSLNIPFIEWLPSIEEESEVEMKTPQEIAKRILVLVYLCCVAETGKRKEEIIEFLKKENLWHSVSEEEKELFQKELSAQEKADISWRTEAVWLLLWVINKVEKLDLPENEIPVRDVLEKIPKLISETSNFVTSAVIRVTPEILDASDLIYRLHWAVKHSEVDTKFSITNLFNFKKQKVILNPNVVYQRHYAINWVTGNSDNWDDIQVDT